MAFHRTTCRRVGGYVFDQLAEFVDIWPHVSKRGEIIFSRLQSHPFPLPRVEFQTRYHFQTRNRFGSAHRRRLSADRTRVLILLNFLNQYQSKLTTIVHCGAATVQLGPNSSCSFPLSFYSGSSRAPADRANYRPGDRPCGKAPRADYSDARRAYMPTMRAISTASAISSSQKWCVGCGATAADSLRVFALAIAGLYTLIWQRGSGFAPSGQDAASTRTCTRIIGRTGCVFGNVR